MNIVIVAQNEDEPCMMGFNGYKKHREKNQELPGFRQTKFPGVSKGTEPCKRHHEKLRGE
jgi:hypothetical protein